MNKCSRKDFLKAGVAGLVPAVMIPTGLSGQSERTAKVKACQSAKPNIVIIMADQLRRQALGCYGDKNVSTPNIDALSRSSVMMQRAYASFPVCVPFRFCFMTGQYPHTRNVPSIGYRMSPSETTLADAWNADGYHTTYVGKWHLYGDGHGVLPGYNGKVTNRTPVPREHQGRWQTWRGFELSNAHFDTCYFEDDDPEPKKIEGYQTDGLFDVAMQELNKQAAEKKPIACVLSVEPPHPPYEAPPELSEKWKEKDLHLDPNFLKRNEALDRYAGHPDMADPEDPGLARWKERQYYAMVENFDENVGRFMKFLDSSGLRESTIVVLMADHGHLGGRHCWQQKGKPFEESIGIPLLVSDPRHQESWGKQVSTLMGMEDFYPTLLGLTGSPLLQEVPGKDLSKSIQTGRDDRTKDALLLESTYVIRPDLPEFDKGWRGVLTDRYKYVVQGDVKSGGEPWMLYDLKEDPYELNNLVDDSGMLSVLKTLHGRLRALLIETGDDYPLSAAFGVKALNLRVSS